MDRQVGRLSHAVRLPLVVAALSIIAVLLGDAGAVVAESNWAQVNGDGTLVKSRGVTANFRDTEGGYRIEFKRDVSKCAYAATVRDVANYFIIARPNPLNVRQVDVFIYGISSFSDSGFSLKVFC
jgi:hypothetical protein